MADILLTTDVARLSRAKKNNLFEKVNSDILRKNIPKKYIHNPWEISKEDQKKYNFEIQASSRTDRR